MSVDEAARRLDVVPQRVRVLIAEGRLPAQRVGRRYVLDRADVDRFARAPRIRGRPLNAANAWALLALLALLPDEQSLAERPARSVGRIQSLVGQGHKPVLAALRSSEPRAALHMWRVLPGDVDALLEDPGLVKSGLSANARAINVRYEPARDGVDAYVSGSHLRALERKLHPIVGSNEANVLLRVPQGAGWILDEPVAPLSVVGADLLDHEDARVARAGRDAVVSLVE
jgi:excisionase family DNA binding protein